MSTVKLLSGSESAEITRDARVAAIRWDVVSWGLVLDLDAPLSEGADVPMRRAWLVFEDVSDISWPMNRARLPNGCWLASEIGMVPANGGVEYRFNALLPRFRDDDSMEEEPAQTVTIKARALRGVRSEGAAMPGECGVSWSERVRLATDEELIAALSLT
ncbi:hypothetical protein [Anaeromyxobacter oryzisoli]|uniref:hypothetical protein n=1 Tax=Anaeromyxobacter oryzisoli TaxID=2925408 RepID=UPI001F58E84B|nr:hypothetical protein [Anaeromyxobacter sp. SG63]